MFIIINPCVKEPFAFILAVVIVLKSFTSNPYSFAAKLAISFMTYFLRMSSLTKENLLKILKINFSSS